LNSHELMPIDAATAILTAFDTVPLVALGETHCVQEEADFWTMLLCHPTFPTKVNAIVVEFGNALHQPVIDRFVAGAPVANSDLRPVWRDCIGGLLGVWDAPMYEQFFRTVRAVNRLRSPAERIRVFLGDPPFDWRTADSPDSVEQVLGQRDSHYAMLVEQEVLRQGQRALLIAGGYHFFRLSAEPQGNVVQRLEEQYPGSMFVVLPHCGFVDQTTAFDEIEARLAQWPIGAVAHLPDTWLGSLDPHQLFGDSDPPYFRLGGQPLSAIMLSDLVDAYLYLGPRSTLTGSQPNPAIYHGDVDYLSELQRRQRLRGWGYPLDAKTLFRERAPQYWTG
jgi:hypothetical protein